MRACCGRGSNAGRTRASGPEGPNIPATSSVTVASVHPRHEALQLREPLFDLGCVGRPGNEVEVALEVGHRLCEQGEAEMDRAAVADFFGLIGDDAKEQLLDPERHVKIALALIDPLEIVDHPLEDLTVQRAPEELGPERHPAAVRLLQERTALLFGQDLAAV